MKESVILCEGYHDRAFWAGWLEHLGCTDPGHPPDTTGRRPVQDPMGRRVSGGQFAFRSRTDKFIRIVPCGGDRRRVVREARSRLSEEGQRLAQAELETRLARLVINVDPDVSADAASSRTGFQRDDLRPLVHELDPGAAKDEHEDFVLFHGRILVSLVRWEANDAAAVGLPIQQTLERLVCAAVTAAYPDRGPAVQKWLDSRPNGPQPGPKEFGWSYMAGWYAKFGCEAFFRHVWEEDAVRSELESRLRNCSAWRIAEALAE